MSLVGPRPPVMSEVEHYDADYWLRLRLNPGMTGLWQITGRSALSYSRMVELDLEYWQHWTLKRELAILLATIPTVLGARGTA